MFRQKSEAQLRKEKEEQLTQKTEQNKITGGPNKLTTYGTINQPQQQEESSLLQRVFGLR